MLDLPRSVRFATWLAAVQRGDARLEDAVTAVHGQDEPHTAVTALPAGLEVPDEGVAAVMRWLAPRARWVGVALPEPGHLLGLPGPAEFNAAALDAGECVLVELDAPPSPGVEAVGLVPEVTEFGSWLEPGVLVQWQVLPAAAPRVVDLGSLSEAERALREAMREATEALADLDVARWRDDAGHRIEAIRDGGLDRRVAPGSTAPRALRVLASAARVRAIVELAAQDDGAALTGWHATRRAAALREVDQVARRAMVAAVNLPG